MKIGAAFDASYIKGKSGCFTRDLDIHNIQATNHHIHLEDDYSMLRDKGFTFFRDSCWLIETQKGNWDYTDRLAKLSNKDIQLTISHYEYPSVDMEEFAEKLAERYKGIFHSYIPVVESGYWAAMVGEWKRWGQRDGWWDAWSLISPLILSILQGLKKGDPSCRIASAEPWNYSPTFPYSHQTTPFDLVGDSLDIVGLNIYHPDKVAYGLIEARKLFPNKEIMITETGNCHNLHISPEKWLNILEGEILRSGIQVSQVVWSPIIQMLNFEQGEPGEGHLYDINRQTPHSLSWF